MFKSNKIDDSTPEPNSNCYACHNGCCGTNTHREDDEISDPVIEEILGAKPASTISTEATKELEDNAHIPPGPK